MKQQNKKTKNKTQITAAFKKPTLSPIILKQNTQQGLRHMCLQCFLAAGSPAHHASGGAARRSLSVLMLDLGGSLSFTLSEGPG